jgi:hypothetical protein
MLTTPTAKHSGGCLCGGVRYSVVGQLRPIVYCHCGQCKKSSGNYVAASACDDVEFNLDRDETLRWFASSAIAERGFCKSCGSNLFWKPSDSGHMSIFAGTLDSDAGLKARAHIYVESKADYLVIGDSLPQYQQRGPGAATSVTE